MTDLIDSEPIYAIVIDLRTQELEEALDALPLSTKIIEFKTYEREKIGIGVHIHSFETLFEKETIVGPKAIKISVASEKKAPRVLIEVLEVVQLMYKNYSCSHAVKNIANKYNIRESTVRDKCTRQLGLNTRQFNQLVQNKADLLSLLRQRYPAHKTLIEERLM